MNNTDIRELHTHIEYLYRIIPMLPVNRVILPKIQIEETNDRTLASTASTASTSSTTSTTSGSAGAAGAAA